MRRFWRHARLAPQRPEEAVKYKMQGGTRKMHSLRPGHGRVTNVRACHVRNARSEGGGSGGGTRWTAVFANGGASAPALRAGRLAIRNWVPGERRREIGPIAAGVVPSQYGARRGSACHLCSPGGSIRSNLAMPDDGDFEHLRSCLSHPQRPHGGSTVCAAAMEMASPSYRRRSVVLLEQGGAADEPSARGSFRGRLAARPAQWRSGRTTRSRFL